MRWLTDTVYGVSNPHDAAAHNRVSKMKKYVQQGGDVSKKNKLGDIPLHEACAYIRDDGETSKGKKRTGYIMAKRRVGKLAHQEGLGEGGPLEMLELLVRAGSDVNAQNIVGDAPLHKAALNGRALAADYLIHTGADVNIRNEFAQTPLHMACVSGSIEVVQKLVQGGADTSAQNAAEETPFHEACRHQYEIIVIYLLRQAENADSSQNLRLWRGLDASWKTNIRERAQDHVDRAGDKGQHPPVTVPATVAPFSASDGVEVGSVLMTPPRKGHGITRPGMKASPSTAGRATPPSRVIRDVRVGAPTREGIRRASARKSKNALVLQSPRPRVSRRSLAHPDSAKGSVRTGRGLGSKAGVTNGSERTSRRPPLFLKDDSNAHAVGAKPRKGVAPTNAENISGDRDGPDSTEQVQHRSRRREDLGRAGGGIVGDIGANVDDNVVAGKSSHRQRRHQSRDLDPTRLSPARDKTVRRRQHNRHEGVASGSRNGSSSSSARDISRRESKSGRSVSGAVAAPGDVPSAAKVGVEGAKVIVSRARTPRAHNDSPRRGVQRQTKVVARENSGGGHERSVKCPHRRSGSGQELVLIPPTWASEIDVGPSKMPPYKKKVLESPVPVKRNSPNIPYRISSPLPRLQSGGAAMHTQVSPSKDGFFPLGTSHATPRARTPASSRRKPDDIVLGAVADSSPAAPIISVGHSRKPSVADGAGAAPESKAVLVAVAEDDGPPDIESLYAGLSVADAGAGSGANEVEMIVSGEGGTPVTKSSSIKRAAKANSKGAVVFSDSETDNDRASNGGGQASAASTTFGVLGSIPAMPAPAHPPVPPSVAATSSFQSFAETTISDEDVELTMEKSVEGAASSLVFHGSFGAGSASSPGEGSRAVVAAAVAAAAASLAFVTFPSPLNEPGNAKSLSWYRSGGGTGSTPTKDAWVAGVRAAATKAKEAVGVVRVEEPLAFERGESLRSFDSDLTQDSGRRVTHVESKAPLKSMPASMITSSSPKLPTTSRKHSSLGRRGQPLVKVNMPIVGGQAAWNKFLADAAAEGEGTRRIDEGDDAAGSAFNDDKAQGIGDAEEKDREEAGDGDEKAMLDINERVPRGFKNPIQTAGPKKGPAGAFSGNSMWRLAGGGASAANRAQPGLEVNGDGGFSNPLAAMRASSARKRSETGAAGGGAVRGGASLNPISGLRGAATMNGAGIPNPLARGRILRLETAGAVNLPLDSIGVGTANPLARRAPSAAIATPMGATTEGDDREGPGERARPTTLMGDRSRLDSVGCRNEIALASALNIVQLAENSLRVYDFALPSSSPLLSPSSASAGLDSSDEAAAEAGEGGRKELLSSEAAPAASAMQPSGGVRALGMGGFRSNGKLSPLRLRRGSTVHENELPHEADRDPEQAKVASTVMAFQKMGKPRAGIAIKDPHQIEVSTVAGQGLVQLRRGNWSPHCKPTGRDRDGRDL